MNIIITMAGMGQRFRDAGYSMPKYEILAQGKSLFEWSLESLNDFFNENWIFVTLKNNHSKNFIESTLNKLGIKNYSVVEIEKMTDGQATTVLFAEPYILINEPIAIFNIDTHIKPFQILKKQIHGDGFVTLFEANGTKWSFATFDEQYKITDIAEKVIISNFATIGFYCFKSFSFYKSLYDIHFNNVNRQKLNERYIAPIYKTAIENNANIFCAIIKKNYVRPIGTPEDLQIFNTINLTDYE